jgi:hypothetical protein
MTQILKRHHQYQIQNSQSSNSGSLEYGVGGDLELLQEGYALQVVLPDLAFVNLVAASLQQLMKYYRQLI